MNPNNTVLIAGSGSDIDGGRFLYGTVLSDNLPKNLRLISAGGLFQILKLSRSADTIFALSPVGSGYAGYLAAKLYNKNFIIKIDDDYAWQAAIQRGDTYLLAGDFQKFKKNGVTARMHKRQFNLCKKAKFVIVPSRFMAGIVKEWGIAEDKIKIISKPINFSSPEISKEEARKKIGILGNIIVSVGPLVPWKGFRMLVKIMPQLISMNQFFRLVILGNGPDLKILQAMIKNSGLDRRAYLIQEKNRDEVALYMAAADMFILNSGHEPFPVQTILAMASGVPVITTAVGANPEIIKQGENGFMIRYNDEFNLIEAVKTIWHTPELRQGFIEGGKKTAAGFIQLL